MNKLTKTLNFIAVVAVVFALFLAISPSIAFAQDNVDVKTPTAEPPNPTATEPPAPTATEPAPTAPPASTATPTRIVTQEPEPSEPVPIPEPITVVLFGTGLAALSAAAAARRKQD